MLGVFSFWMIGIITWLWPRLTGNEWYDRRLNHWQYWLMMLGLLIMFIDLLAAGLVHGNMQKNLTPWMEIVRMLQPYWAIRTFAGGMIIAGLLCWCFNLFMTARTKKPYDYRVDLVEPRVGA